MPLPDILDEDYVPSQSIDESYTRIENLIEQLLLELCDLGGHAVHEPQAISESPMIRLCHEMQYQYMEYYTYEQFIMDGSSLSLHLATEAIVEAVHGVLMSDLSEYEDYWELFHRKREEKQRKIDEWHKRMEEGEGE